MGFVDLLIKPVVPSVLETIVPGILSRAHEAERRCYTAEQQGGPTNQ
jgi:hypothetical protein